MRFDGGHITSDAVVLRLRELEKRFGIIDRLADFFDDLRFFDRQIILREDSDFSTPDLMR